MLCHSFLNNYVFSSSKKTAIHLHSFLGKPLNFPVQNSKLFLRTKPYVKLISSDDSFLPENPISSSKPQKKGLAGVLPLPLAPIPHYKIVEYSEEVFEKPAKFLGSVDELSQETFEKWPNKLLPEVAFMGVSNAGKSTLINALIGEKKMVKTSKKPGHTKALNLFQAGNRFVLVDMPGYGHKSRVEWGELVEKYLTEGVSKGGRLKRVYLLIESKRNFKHLDQMIIEILERLKVPYQILVTKADKLNPKLWKECYLAPQTSPLASFIRQHAYSIADPSLLFISPVRAHFGIAQLRCQILAATGLIPNRLKEFSSNMTPDENIPTASELRAPSKAARREHAAKTEDKVN